MTDDTTTSRSQFSALARDYIREHFACYPAAATFHAYPGFDHNSPELTASGVAGLESREDIWLARFASFEAHQLTLDEEIDRDLVCSALRGRQLRREAPEWRRSPDYYLSPALMGIFALFLRRPLPDAELVEAVRSRLLAVPELLAARRANLDAEQVPPLYASRGIGQCRAGESYARDLVPAEVTDPGLQARLGEAGEVAANAFASFATHLTDLVERGRGEWAIGARLYSKLLREEELLSFDSEALHARGATAWNNLNAEMTALARVIDPDAAGWPEVVRACSQSRPTTPDEMRQAYEDETARTRAFLVEHNLVTLPPDERCDVVPSPTFQRPVLAVASYFQPPAFGDSRIGRFNVPYPPEGTSDDDLAERLADNGYHTVPTITAHEAYPGHHWHLTAMLDTSPLRRVHRSPYFAEGWGLYAKKMMREQGYFADPRDELLHLDARIFRAARIVVDTALHSGDMTVETAVAEMQAKAGLTEAVARVEVQRYCAWPTQASAYLTGSLEIERMRDRWLEQERGDLRTFHDTLARSGCLPLPLAERATFT